MGEPVKIYGLTTGLVDSVGLLLDFFVFEDDELLDSEHLFAVTLNRDQLVIGLRLLNLEENLEDLVVLVLDLDESQLLLLVLTDKADELSALLNLIEGLNKLVGEVLNPLDVLVLDPDEGLTDTLLPLVDDVDVLFVLHDGFRSVRLDLLELLQLVLVLLVDVVQVFRGHDTLQALVLLLCFRVEGRGGIMRHTIDSQRALRVDLLSFEQESVVDDSFADVAFHVGGSLLVVFLVDEAIDDIKGRRVLILV